MKGIILAGGKGTRLYPITKAISKQLLPVYDKPMIYYSISTLIQIGISEILIITTPEDQVFFKNLLTNNDDFKAKFSFEIQKKPRGIGDAFLVGEKFIKNDNVCLILGDNLFFDSDLIRNNKMEKSSKIFVKKVNNPNQYGVLEKIKTDKYLIHEKPKTFVSNLAIVGLYMFTNSVVSKAKKLKPSIRGELEITDINNQYLKNNDCEIIYLEKDSKWFDSGTFDSLLEASIYVRDNL